MKNSRITSLLFGGLALAAMTFGSVGCGDHDCVDPTTVETTATAGTTSESLFSIYQVDQTAISSEELLPTFEEALSGAVLTDDGALMLPPPPGDSSRGGDDNGGRGRGGDDGDTTRGGDDGGRGGRDSVRRDDSIRRDDSLRGDRGRRDSVRRDSTRREPPRRDSAVLNIHGVERLLGSLPGMNDSLRRALRPCFEEYRAAVGALRARYTAALRELRGGFNADVRALMADSTLTREEKRARFGELQREYQAAARELKAALDTAMREALAALIECIAGHLNDDQLAAFREGLARLR